MVCTRREVRGPRGECHGFLQGAAHPELHGVEYAGVAVTHRLHPVPALREQRGDVARNQMIAALAPACPMPGM